MNNIYTKIKSIFIQEDNTDWFINLNQSINCYNKIISALKKPLKLILFYGKPGSGKTFLLDKIVKDLQDNIIFLKTPFFTEKEFINCIFKNIYKKNHIETIDNFENFMEFHTKYNEKTTNNILENQIIIILDEAQLYPNELIEKIRLMADSRYFKFLFTVHKTDKEDVLAKDYFTTRIWESIELKNISTDEIKLYIKRRLQNANFEPNFEEKDYEFINFVTDGNLRTINKLMYKFYEICEYYEKNEPSKLLIKNTNNKILNMSAIAVEVLK